MPETTGGASGATSTPLPNSMQKDLAVQQFTIGTRQDALVWVVTGLLLVVSHAAGLDASEPTATAKRRYQHGIRDYRAALDLEVWEVAPTKVLEKQGTMTSDADNGGGESQVLLRFDKIIGRGPDQVPPKVRIVSAKLTVTAFDPGNTVHLHRVLVPWSASSTWNSLSAGLSADDLEATRLRDGFTFGHIVMDKQSVEFDVTGAVQSWVNGAPNFGWVFINSGSNGWDFYSSDWHEVELRPFLEVEFEPKLATPATAAR
jgi:hypothetical protein